MQIKAQSNNKYNVRKCTYIPNDEMNKQEWHKAVSKSTFYDPIAHFHHLYYFYFLEVIIVAFVSFPAFC